MKFYVITNLDGGETAGCELTLNAAKREAQSFLDYFSIDCIDVAVTADNVRRMLGNIGGYARDSREVFRKEKQQ
jgi:hypothetical protein